VLLQAADCTATDGTVIRRFPALQGESVLNAVENVSIVSFNSLGALTATAATTRSFDLCHEGQNGRRIFVSLIGRSKSHKPDDPNPVRRPVCP
jgi:hypothetical protein